MEKSQTSKAKPFWTIYEVRWDFLTKLCGSVPADPELIKKWLAAREPEVKPPGGRSIGEVQEEVFSSLAEPEEEGPERGTMLVFQRDNGHLAIRAGTIKAHLKDCARQISTLYVGKIAGEKAFSTKVKNGLYPDEKQYWVPILRTDTLQPVKEADGTFDKAVHVWTRKGQVSAIKNIEFMMGATLIFKLKVFGSSVNETDLDHLFRYGGTHGYGGERGDGEGRYSPQFHLVETEV